MALRTEFWVKRPNQVEVMSKNMAAGQEHQRLELDETDIYCTKLMKDNHFPLKFSSLGNLWNLRWA